MVNKTIYRAVDRLEKTVLEKQVAIPKADYSPIKKPTEDYNNLDELELTTNICQHLKKVYGQRVKILEQIGSGGMGSVYLIRIGNKERALKLCTTYLEDAKAAKNSRRMFKREVILQGKSSKLIPTPKILLDGIEPQTRRPYLLMEYIGGTTFDEFSQICDGQKTIEQIIALATQLGTLHAKGIIHRDVKPKNIIIGDNTDKVHLIDFGIARHIDDHSDNPEVLYGTPAYSAPETQIKLGDAKSDQHSVGTMLFEAITGELPFSTMSFMEVLREKHKKIQVNPDDVRSDFPEGIAGVVEKCLNPNPEERYESCAHLAGELHELIQKPN